MRRAAAIVLAALFSWTLMLPLLASSTIASVPACCRKHGKHHCMRSSSQTGVTSVGEKCPSFPKATVAAHSEYFTPATAAAVYAELASHPAVCPQTEAGHRISYDRSRQKRGPPTSHLV